MYNPFIGQIVAYAGSYPPRGWALCDGSIIAIRSNTALFSILGTTYGGDGKTTFALPNLNGQVVIGSGAAVNGSPYDVGDKVGSKQNTLDNSQMPAHTHALGGGLTIPVCSTDDKDTASPAGAYLSAEAQGNDAYASTANSMMGAANLSLEIGSAGTPAPAPFTLMQPVTGMLYCIALQGIFPQRD